MDRPGLAEVMTAPLTLLERSRGWRRRALVLAYLAVAVLVAAFGWRAASLWRLPNSPEPFDLEEHARVEVPDPDNAMVAYRAVFAKFGELDPRGVMVASKKGVDPSDWSAADPGVRRWAEDHREALEAWVPANDRRDSLLVQPGEHRMGTLLGPVRQLRPYVQLALLEGSRLEQSGDLEGAWRTYRAALRASRHAGGHGGAIQRLVGNALLRQCRPRVEAWVDHPGMTPGLLRRAIADVEACRAMTGPASEMVRAEYYSARDTLNTPEVWANLGDSGPYSRTEWSNQLPGVIWARRFLRREPERSARVLRLIAAGYLAQCDRPRALRPRLASPDSMIYDHDPQTPPPVRSIAPEALDSWSKDSILSDLTPFHSQIQALLDDEVGIFDRFLLRMAARAFEVEHKAPPKTYGDLRPYLRALPEGIDPRDPVDPGAG